MSTVLNHSRKLLITQLKSELNYRLMVIAGRMQRTAAQSQNLIQEKAQIQSAEVKKLLEEGAENLTIQNINNIAYLTTDIDTELTLLEIQDEQMEAEMKMIDTQLKALNAEEEQIDKVLDNSIKKEFGIFKS